MQLKHTILLVEDDRVLLDMLAEALQVADYTVTRAVDGATALRLLVQHQFDVVVTDLRLHDIDGIEVLQQARQQELPPSVIVLTGYGSLDTAIEALRAGAYDYMLKPYNIRRLLASIAGAVEQRATRLQQAEAIAAIAQGVARLRPGLPDSTPPDLGLAMVGGGQDTLRVGGLVLNYRRHTASFNSQPLHLTPTEYALLRCLAEAQGRVVPYNELVRATHGHIVGDLEAKLLLKSHVRNLRRKIGSACVVNVGHVGYMLSNSPDD